MTTGVRLFPLAAVLLVTLIVIGALAVNRGSHEPSEMRSVPVTKGEAPVVVHIESSWARSYSDVRSLTADSSIVVHVRVEGPREVVRRQGRVAIYTRIPVEILDIAKGDSSAGERILVIQPGAIEGETHYITTDDPLLEPGREYVLFLAEHDTNVGAHFVQGGAKGQMIVSDGRATSLSQALAMPESFTDLGFEDIPVPEMLALVREHRDATPEPFPSQPVYGQ